MADDPTDQVPLWLSWPLGARVVVRRRLPEGGFSDVLGELLESDADGVLVATRRRGDVYVPGDVIAVGKIVPDRPLRHGLGAGASATGGTVAGSGPQTNASSGL